MARARTHFRELVIPRRNKHSSYGSAVTTEPRRSIMRRAAASMASLAASGVPMAPPAAGVEGARRRARARELTFASVETRKKIARVFSLSRITDKKHTDASRVPRTGILPMSARTHPLFY